MLPISLRMFEEQKGKEPHRRCFAQHPDIHQPATGNPYFRPPFPDSIMPIFEAQTGMRLLADYGSSRCFCYLNTPEEETTVRGWIESQGSRIFLRDCLSCSIALGMNKDDPTASTRTPLGQLEYEAKTNNNEAAIVALSEHLATTIASLPLYNSTPFIVAVPARPGKTNPDLPTELAKRVAESFKLTDLTPHFRYAGTREQLKALPLAERWAAWEGAGLSLSAEGAAILQGHPVILIDDKYQSGVSANFVAMILQRHGASSIYGLYAVKTMRDTDNA